MTKPYIGVVLLIFSLFSFSPVAATVKLQSYSGDTSLPHNLLKAALERAGLEYSHPFESDKDVANTRIMNEVKSGGMDIMWSMTSRELENNFQAIYFPIFRGLMGMRLAIVKKNNAEIFKNVTTLSDLKRFSAGQGKVWPDTKILQHNGLKVAKTLKYPNLFYMLEGDRFDYFPRGINEPWDEIKRHESLNLTVDRYIMIRYRAPVYFFVKKGNNDLINTLNNSLEEMIRDGTFESMFLSDSQVVEALSLANVSERVVIDIENPLLTEKTPINRKELWFDPLTYKGK